MKNDKDPTFWQLLQTRGNEISPGEDVADTIALLIIMGLICFVIFI